MRKINEENERIKRRYLQYLKAAKRKDPSTVQKAAEGILRFEASTNYASFKRFHIEQAIKFHDRLNAEISKTTGKPLSKSTISQRACGEQGRSSSGWPINAVTKAASAIRTPTISTWMPKGQRVASATRETPYPSMEMARHAFNYMPEAIRD